MDCNEDAPLGAPTPQFIRGEARDDGVPGAAKIAAGEAYTFADSASRVIHL